MTVRRGLLLLAFLLVEVAWALSLPVSTAPDEPAHTYRAAGVWSGQWLPDRLTPAPSPYGGWQVQVPAGLADLAESTACTRFNAADAGCSTLAGRDEGVTTVNTWAGRYLPVYYAAVGAPTRASDAAVAIYGTRLLSGAGTAVLLWLAALCLLTLPNATTAVFGLLVAATPTVTWLGAMINPNGWEIAGAVLAWSAGLAWTRLGGKGPQWLVPLFLVGVVVLTLSRLFSPLWLAILLATLLVLGARPAFAALERRTRATVLTVIGACVAGAVGWYGLAESASAQQWPVRGSTASAAQVLVQDLTVRQGEWFRQMYGVLGWLDTSPPGPAVQLWVVALLLVLVAGLVLGPARGRVALTLLLAACIAVPAVLETWYWSRYGTLMWQGRYTLPLACGIPLVAAVTAGPAIERLGLRAAPYLACALPVASCLVTFVAALHRYVHGAGRSWSDPEAWSPPVGVPAALGLAAGGLVAVVLLLASSAWTSGGAGPGGTSPANPAPPPH